MMTAKMRTSKATPAIVPNITPRYHDEDWTPKLDTLAGTTGVTLLGFVTVEEANVVESTV
jgi:hypothetical protein